MLNVIYYDYVKLETRHVLSVDDLYTTSLNSASLVYHLDDNYTSKYIKQLLWSVWDGYLNQSMRFRNKHSLDISKV